MNKPSLNAAKLQAEFTRDRLRREKTEATRKLTTDPKPLTISPSMTRKTDYIQVRVGADTKQSLLDYAFKTGIPMTTLILVAMSQAYPELKEVIDRDRRTKQ